MFERCPGEFIQSVDLCGRRLPHRDVLARRLAAALASESAVNALTVRAGMGKALLLLGHVPAAEATARSAVSALKPCAARSRFTKPYHLGRVIRRLPAARVPVSGEGGAGCKPCLGAVSSGLF